MSENLLRNLFIYKLTAIFSVFFALAGFSYNVWRMEVTETNSNIRTASFEILTELAALEEIVYAAAYDGDLKEGSPRKGWVKVRLVQDLSMITTKEVQTATSDLQETWSAHWQTMASDQEAAESIVSSIDHVREELSLVLSSLN